jgi:pilus assembly protein CpaB
MLIALLLAGLSAVLVYATIARQDTGSDGGTATGDLTQVVVAKDVIPERTRITEDMLQLKNVPTVALVDGAFVSTGDVVGKVTKLPIARNAQVVQTAVIDTNAPVADSLSSVVPEGKRAFSITASQVVQAGGLILPGDWVDVVWICCDDKAVLAKTVVQNVQVAAVAQNILESGPTTGSTDNPVAADTSEPDPEAATITMLMTTDQIHQVFLAEISGELRVDLRGVGDTTLEPPSNDFTLVTELLPVEVLATLPQSLWPDGYKDR